MLTTIVKFFAMGGYGIYVWPAYTSVVLLLSAQWLIPWRRWRNYLRNSK